MENNRPLVSIITVNYNSTETTLELLESIKNLNYRATEVIVVDNASSQNPQPAIGRVYPAAKVIVSDRNLGFAGGNNLGIAAASGELLFFVNNDTEFTAGLVGPLVEVFDRHPDAGMACPKFHYYYHPQVIEYAGYNPLNVFRGSCSMVGNGQTDNGQFDLPGPTNFAHGGAMMVPSRIIKQVGMMPQCYFLYYEELDWSEQIKKKGYRIYYEPKSLIYHKESMSVGKKSLIKTYYHCRNRILFMRRNVSPAALLVFTLYFIFLTIPKNSLGFLVRGETNHLKAFWKGILWNCTHFAVKNIQDPETHN